MADLEITGLTAGTPKGTDLHIAVDTTDPTMAASGTDKKYLWSDLRDNVLAASFLAGPTEVLVSAGAGVAPVGDSSFTFVVGSGVLTAPTLLATTAIRFEDPGVGSNYVALQAGTLSGNTTYTLPTSYPASSGYVLSSTTAGVLSWVSDSTGGDVAGPASSVANTIATYADTTGKLIQDTSAVLVGGALSALTQLDVDNLELNGNTISSTDTNGNILLSPNGTGIVSASGAVQTASQFIMTDIAPGANTIAISAPSGVSSSYAIRLPGGTPTNDQVLTVSSFAANIAYMTWTDATGDVNGPASSTDNAVARFDGTTGKIIQNSPVVIGDTGVVTGVTSLAIQDSGSAFSNIFTSPSLAASKSYILPNNYPSVSGYSLVSDTSGNLSWADNGGFVESTVSTTWLGVWASGQSGNIKAYTDGTTVQLLIPAVSATATTAAVVTNTGTELPLALRPSADQKFPIFAITDNAIADLLGHVLVASTGVVTISLASAGIPHVQGGGVFTGSGATGWTAFSISYLIS